jgi:type II secretory pathway component GspD/PulD (secretin)
VFQAKLKGWKRVAASLLMLPGLTAVGAEMLHLIGPARAAERTTAPADAAKLESARAMMKQAYAAFGKGDYAKAQRLAETVRSMNVPLQVFDDSPDELLAEIQKKTGGKMSGPARTTSEDPRALVKKAKNALEAGRLDAAQDLAHQADANGRTVSWGLFEDTPASVLRDVQKARGKRDRTEADLLLSKARVLYEKRVSSEEQRAANLDKARAMCLQAAQLHGPYSMWDFGDRPQSMIKDIEVARGKLKVAPRRDDPMAADIARQPKSNDPFRDPENRQTGYNAVKTPGDGSKNNPTETVRQPKSNDPFNDPETKQTGYNPIKPGNVGRDGNPIEDLTKLPRNMKPVLPEDANNLILPDMEDPKVASGNPAKLNVDPVDPGTQGNVRKTQAVQLMKESQNLQRDHKYLEAQEKLVEARKQNATFGPDEESPELALQKLVARAHAHVNELCRGAHERMVKKTAQDVAQAEQNLAEAESIAAGLGLDRWAISEHRNTLRIIKGNTSVASNMMPPDVPKKVDETPDLVIPPNPKSQTTMRDPEPMMPKVDVGLQMLGQARAEFQAAQFENARKIVAQVLNGEYTCKNEAQDLLRTIDAAELTMRKETARHSFDRAAAAFQNRSYEQALSIFKLIDPTLLPQVKQTAMKDMSMQAVKALQQPDTVVQNNNPMMPREVLPAPVEKNGADSLLKQQEALMELHFQKLRSRGLQVEATATARFGKGETDAALADLQGFILEVNGANIDHAKRAMLTRPIEARVERLKVLKHQQDFLTREAKDLKNFRNQMTQEALNQAHKKEEVAKLMKSFNRLLEEGKYQEASKVALQARELDPEDPAAQAAMHMSRMMHRERTAKQISSDKEQMFLDALNAVDKQGPHVDFRDGVKFDLEEWNNRIRNRQDYGPGLGNSHLRTEKEKEIESMLKRQTISINFKNTPLDEVISYMQTYSGINFDIDTGALKEASIDPKTEITSSLKDIRLVSALGVVLDKAKLRWVIDKEVVKITTARGAQGKLVRRTVPVADLVVPVQNAQQSPTQNLQEMLRQSMLNTRPGSMGSNAMPVTPITGLPTGSGSMTGSPSAAQPGIGRLQNVPGGSGSGTIVNRSNASGTIEESLIRLITSSVAPQTWEAMGGPGRIEYYPLGMALVINQSPEVIEEVTRLLESLRRLQDLEVAIEIRYINLSEAFYERIGLDFGMNLNTHNDRTLVNLANAGGGTQLDNMRNLQFAGAKIVGLQAPGTPTPDLDLPIRATSFGMAIPPFGGFPNSPGADGGLSLGLAFLSDIQVQMFLEAAQGDRRTNIMQAPRLTMFNGQTASLSIQEQAFFLTGVSVFAVNGQLVFQPQNSPFPVGINLTLQPVISSDRRFVRLSINQSVGGFGGAGLGGISNSTFSAPASVPLIPITTIITPVFEGGSQGQPVPFTQFLQQPTFSSIDVQTTVMVPDGGTVVLGGLKALSEGRNEFGPPVLSKVPYLNRLFRNVGYGRTTSNLMMLVTPRIIINREEQERQTGVVEGVGEEFLQ